MYNSKEQVCRGFRRIFHLVISMVIFLFIHYLDTKSVHTLYIYIYISVCIMYNSKEIVCRVFRRIIGLVISCAVLLFLFHFSWRNSSLQSAISEYKRCLSVVNIGWVWLCVHAAGGISLHKRCKTVYWLGVANENTDLCCFHILM